MEKIALITGATHNVGKSIAETLSREGYLVIVTSNLGNEARDVATHLPHQADYYEVDFSSAAQIEGLFSFIKNKYDRLDVLVNNVARNSDETILECDLDTWERTINTNLRSYYLCTRLAALLMKDHGGGNIVNIAISATRAAKNKFSYAVSKGAIQPLTMVSAVHLAPYNIRVNAIGIGAAGTPVGNWEHPERKRDYINPKIPAGHIADPSDIADAVSFLVSDKARYIYGALLPVDGGADISM